MTKYEWDDVFVILFSFEFHSQRNVDHFLSHFSSRSLLSLEFSEKIIHYWAYINQKIEEYSVDWSLNRIHKSDLTILRLGVYFILMEPIYDFYILMRYLKRLSQKYSMNTSYMYVYAILQRIKNE